MTDSDDRITLSTGVVLRAVAAPVWLIQEAVRRIPKPRAPRKVNPNTEVEEEDEYDPSYIEATEGYKMAALIAVNDAMLLLGTQVAEVPPGFDRIDDPGWADEIGSLGFDISAMNRRLAWLKYWAVRSGDDQTRVITAVARKTGVREEDVADAVTSFRGGEERLANRGPDAPAAGANGNHVSDLPARRRGRVRGA